MKKLTRRELMGTGLGGMAAINAGILVGCKLGNTASATKEVDTKQVLAGSARYEDTIPLTAARVDPIVDELYRANGEIQGPIGKGTDTTKMNFWDEYLAAYAYVTAAGSYQKLVGDVLRSMSPLSSGAHIADLGCGSGVIAKALWEKGHKVTLVDISRVAADSWTWANERCTKVNDEMQKFIVPENNKPHRQLDGIVFNNSLFPLTNADQKIVLEAALKSLNPGGVMFVNEPIEELHDRDMLSKLLKAAGKEMTDIGTILTEFKFALLVNTHFNAFSHQLKIRQGEMALESVTELVKSGELKGYEVTKPELNFYGVTKTVVFTKLRS